MRSMWTKIGLGAVGIFAMGMLLLTLLRDARASARDAFVDFLGTGDAAAATVPAPPEAAAPEAVAAVPAAPDLSPLKASLAGLTRRIGRAGHDMPFVFEGQRIGSIQRLMIRRARQGELPEVDLEVVITDPAQGAALSDCDLVPEHGTSVTGDDGFSCADADWNDLVTVGTARLEPLGVSRPIRIRQRDAGEMRSGGPFQLTVDGKGVRIHADGRHGEAVQVRTDAGGAGIKIDDALGRAIFRLLADSTGASMRVRGKDGRDVVRMDASGGGFSLTIDTSAAQ